MCPCPAINRADLEHFAIITGLRRNAQLAAAILFVITGITVTTLLCRASPSAAFTVRCLPSLIKLRVVGNGSLNRPLSPPASASRGETQMESVDSLPSWAPACAGGAAARKNQVSKRFGMPSGVIQCA